MRCQRCHFENVPGQSRCFKCGSVLDGQGVAVDVHPPRMPKWKGPLRALVRRFRRVSPEPKVAKNAPDFLRIMSRDAFLGVVLSIIPGLAQYAEGRFREVRWLVVGWFLLFAGGIFFYGSGFGWLLIGLAVGLHAWIAMRHRLLSEIEEFYKRISMLVILLFAFGFLYWGIRRIAFHDFVFGYATWEIPYQKVEAGDCLLARYSRAREETLARGSLVFARFHEVRVGRWGMGRGFYGYHTVGQIAALPGDGVEIKEGRYVVNGRELDSDKFPVPEWLSGMGISTTIPEGRYFVSTVFHLGGGRITSDVITQACILEKDDIDAVAIMRWFPVERRGFLRSYE